MSDRGVIGGLARRVEGLALERPVLVGVDGPDAAGKTVLADELGSELRSRGQDVVRATVDAFARPRAERYARGRESGEGYYRDSTDLVALQTMLLDPLRSGGSRVVRVGSFDVTEDRPWRPEPVRAREDTILICDGVFLLRPELREVWDLSILVTAPFEIRLARALRRDVPRLGSADEVEHRYRSRYEPGQQLYRTEAEPHRHATITIHNDDPEAAVIA